MHIEIQVALNFVISYLYNKLPRRRVNIFGEELEKALRERFQGHWYPEKPFKGSAFRCLKTGDPIDSVLECAARESGVPISDVLENLPAELSVWVDPGEVSYRIGEKGSVKILYSENNENPEDSASADREVNKMFNTEVQSFQPIDVINCSMNSLSLSPKTFVNSGSSSTSPSYKSSPNSTAATGSFLQRTQAPLTFTTATFAQTKFGSTKLKTSSKRANSSYRMSPTEFSNYIKQRAIQQQQLHHTFGPVGSAGLQTSHFGPIGPVSPSRSLSPTSLTMGLGQNSDSFYYSNIASGMNGLYTPQCNGNRNIFDGHFRQENNGLYTNGINGATGASHIGGHTKFNSYLEPLSFYNNFQMQPSLPTQQQQEQQKISISTNGNLCKNNNHVTVTTAISVNASAGPGDNGVNETVTKSPPMAMIANSTATTTNSIPESKSSKLIDGLNSFYPNSTGPYQHLLVAN